MGVRLSGFFGDIYDPRPPTHVWLANLGAVAKPLKPITEEFPIIGGTTFVTLDNEFYHWQTEVELRQIFGPEQGPGSMPSIFRPGDRLRKLVANVKWKCKISPERNFTAETVKAMEFVSEKFETPVLVDYVQLRHPFFSQTATSDNDTGEEPGQ
jgi:hypothetical protein